MGSEIVDITPDAHYELQHADTSPPHSPPNASLPQDASWGGRVCSYRPSCVLVEGVVSLGSLIASSYLLATTYNSFRATPLGSTLSTFALGASIQGLLQSLLPTNALSFLNHLNKDNAFKVWFVLTELYFFYNNDDVNKKNKVLEALTAILGSQAVIKVSDMLSKTLKETPLVSSSPIPIRQNVAVADPEEAPQVCPLALEPSAPFEFALAQLLYKIVPGIIACIFNKSVVGTFLICDGVGTMTGVALKHITITKMANATCQKAIDTAKAIAFVAIESSWGLLMAAFPNDLRGIGGSGFTAGYPTYFYKHRFQHVAQDKAVDQTRHPCLDKINAVSNGIFLAAVVLWTVYNYQQVYDWGERTALWTSAPVIAGAMLTKYFLIKKFQWGKNNLVYNSALYYSEYPVFLAIVYALNENQGGFGSKALIESPVRPLLAGWLPFYLCIGFSCIRKNLSSFIGIEGFAYALIHAEMTGKLD